MGRPFTCLDRSFPAQFVDQLHDRLPHSIEAAAGELVEAVGEAEVERGRIASCATRLQAGAGAWAHGPPAAWLNAVIEGDLDRLELGGDCRLARGLLDSMHETLFAMPIHDRP